MINLILFGPPGSGKGTQAVMIAKKFNLLHISTGDLLRAEMKEETPLGMEAKKYIEKGELVPDEVVIGMISSTIDEHLSHVKGMIFDGFPRTEAQAEALDRLLEFKKAAINKVLSLEVKEEEIVKRILERGKSSGRADDSSEATIRNRFQVYLNETQPIASRYMQQKKYVAISGEGSIEDIFENLCQKIEA